MRKRIKSIRGFTIIEVLVGILIIGIMAGAGVANYRRLEERTAVQGTAKDVEQAIRDTQKRASAGVKDPGFCDSDPILTLEEYSIELGNDPSFSPALTQHQYRVTAFCSDASVSQQTFALPDNIGIVTGVRINFDLLGRSDGEHVVCVSNADNSMMYELVVSEGGSISYRDATVCSTPSPTPTSTVTPTPTPTATPTPTPACVPQGCLNNTNCTGGKVCCIGDPSTPVNCNGYCRTHCIAAVCSYPGCDGSADCNIGETCCIGDPSTPADCSGYCRTSCFAATCSSPGCVNSTDCLSGYSCCIGDASTPVGCLGYCRLFCVALPGCSAPGGCDSTSDCSYGFCCIGDPLTPIGCNGYCRSMCVI